MLVRCPGAVGSYRILGETLDDAGWRGLLIRTAKLPRPWPYPGRSPSLPALGRSNWRGRDLPFHVPMINRTRGLGIQFLAVLKTYALNTVHQNSPVRRNPHAPEIAFAFSTRPVGRYPAPLSVIVH